MGNFGGVSNFRKRLRDYFGWTEYRDPLRLRAEEKVREEIFLVYNKPMRWTSATISDKGKKVSLKLKDMSPSERAAAHRDRLHGEVEFHLELEDGTKVDLYCRLFCIRGDHWEPERLEGKIGNMQVDWNLYEKAPRRDLTPPPIQVRDEPRPAAQIPASVEVEEVASPEVLEERKGVH